MFTYVRTPGLEEGDRYYFELDEARVAYRQMEWFEGRMRVSIAPDFHLSEGVVEPAEGDEEIPADEFEAEWTAATRTFREIWRHAKAEYEIGQQVAGRIIMFYPQGVIVSLGGHAYALADYQEIRCSSRTEQLLYPGYSVTGMIKEADDRNCWFVLEQSRMDERT